MSKQTGDLSSPDDRPVATSKKRHGEWELWYRLSTEPDSRLKWLNRWFKHRSYPTKAMAMGVMEKMKREYDWSRSKRGSGRAAEYVICTAENRPKDDG